MIEPVPSTVTAPPSEASSEAALRSDRGGAPTEVVLADGSKRDLAGLDHDDLDRLQWDQERAFACRIRRSPPGSEARARATREGYDTVTRILARRREGSGPGLGMGYTPRYARLVCALLRARRSGGAVSPRFFEVGFGSGKLLEVVAAEGFDIAGIEVSGHMRQLAAQRLAPALHGGLHLGDFLTHELGGPGSVYDVVYWNDVLEHVHPDESLRYLRRVLEILRPGGVLVTVTPNWHVRPSDITARFLPSRSEAQGFHLKEYTLREVTALLRRAGFVGISTPLLATHRRAVLLRSGLCGLKCGLEPALELLPFRLTRLLCRGLALSCTIASRPA